MALRAPAGANKKAVKKSSQETKKVQTQGNKQNYLVFVFQILSESPTEWYAEKSLF